MVALGLAIAWVDSELSFSINIMESVVTNVNSSDILTESDIPGALLLQEAPELCNVVQLTRWLTCRGASTTGRKVELVSRLVEVSMASYSVFIDKSRTIIVVNAARSIVYINILLF